MAERGGTCLVLREAQSMLFSKRLLSDFLMHPDDNTHKPSDTCGYSSGNVGSNVFLL